MYVEQQDIFIRAFAYKNLNISVTSLPISLRTNIYDVKYVLELCVCVCVCISTIVLLLHDANICKVESTKLYDPLSIFTYKIWVSCSVRTNGLKRIFSSTTVISQTNNMYLIFTHLFGTFSLFNFHPNSLGINVASRIYLWRIYTKPDHINNIYIAYVRHTCLRTKKIPHEMSPKHYHFPPALSQMLSHIMFPISYIYLYKKGRIWAAIRPV